MKRNSLLNLSPSAKPPNIVIVGARTLNQGTGPWLARFFKEKGASIAGVLGSSGETAKKASIELKEKFSISCQGYESWADLRKEMIPDLLVIASPPKTHLVYLEHALEDNIPVFCEKPFLWHTNLKSLLNEAHKILEQFRRQNLFLRLNTQWPESLKAFSSIYPECHLSKARYFRFESSPGSQGSQMILDSLPHAWSLLTAISGLGDLEEIQLVSYSKIKAHFKGIYQGTSRIQFEMILRHCLEQPRPFSFQIDEYGVKRVINMSEYSFSFKTDKGIFPILDPMELRIQNVLDHFDKGIEGKEIDRILLETELLTQSFQTLD